LSALGKLHRYTAIETNRIEGQLEQLGRDDTYTKFILLHGITADVIVHSDISNPIYVSLVLSDTTAATDACMEIVRQKNPITVEFLLATHAQLLKHCRVSVAFDGNNEQVLAAILTGRFKLVPNSPFVKSASEGVPSLLHQYCPPSMVKDHVARFIARAEVYFPDFTLDPYLLAAWLHYTFVAIHPFQDGNGRMSRLLASTALCRNRLFPLLVTLRDKRRYQNVLLAANEGDLLPLSRFIVDMQVQSHLVVLSKASSFLPLNSNHNSMRSSIINQLTTLFGSEDVEMEVRKFDGTSLSKQETSWVVRKDGSVAIHLVYCANIVGQILITTVDPLRLGIIAIDFRDEFGNSLELAIWRNLEGDQEELSDFVTLVIAHIKGRVYY